MKELVSPVSVPSLNCLVTGASGFLGQPLVAALRQQGHQVRAFDLRPSPDPDSSAMVGDLRRPADVAAACQGIDTVFHTASYVGWLPADAATIHDVNVNGTTNLIAACQAAGVRRLVYTGSIDAVFEGRPIRLGDETLPYARRPLNAYSRTKGVAEQVVLAANDPAGLQTCSLRTAGIFGPGDRHRLPSVVRLAQQGQAQRLGNGQARFNHVYVDNVVHAHLLAASALATGPAGAPPAGRAYFIVDDEPTNFYDFVGDFLQALGYAAPARSLPYRPAYFLAALLEAAQRLGLKLPPNWQQFTRYTVAATCVEFSFSHALATRDFGYEPQTGRAEAIATTVAWLRAAGYGAGGSPAG